MRPRIIGTTTSSRVEELQEMGDVGLKKRLGDEESTLLDRFERHSFEVQLNQAILGRTRSEPAGFSRFQSQKQTTMVAQTVIQGCLRRKMDFHKLLNKLLKPFHSSKKERVIVDYSKGAKSSSKPSFSSRSLRL